MNMARVFAAGTALAGSALLLSGCAPSASLSGDEYEAVTTRTYDTDRETFHEAVEELFRLVSDDGMTFLYPAGGTMTVIHDWQSFFFLGYGRGQHVWEITTAGTAEGLEAQVEMGSSSGGEISGTEYDGGSRRTGVLPGGIQAVRSPAVYELFWARMDYLLGVSDSYPRCPQWRERINEDPSLYGPIDGLCGADYVDDHAPSDA